jgi:hypothetical protein
VNSFSLQNGIPPAPTPPQNPQMQVVMNQLSQSIDRSVSEKMVPMANTVTEVMARVNQVEQILAAVVNRLEESRKEENIFDVEERRLLALNASGLFDKKAIQSRWDAHQAEKSKAVKETADASVSGE